MLPLGHELPCLFPMRGSNNEGAKQGKYLLAHDTGAIMGVPYRYFGIGVHDVWYHLCVIDISWSKDKPTKFPDMINGEVELKAIVPTLMILSPCSYASCNAVSTRSFIGAHW